MKNKIYDLTYSWYESDSHYRFTHPKNKLEAEFQQDVQDTILKYLDEHIEKGGCVGEVSEGFKSWIGNDTIIEMVADKLPELGYIPLYETSQIVSFGLWGGSIIDEEHDAEELTRLIGSELSKKVIDYNLMHSHNIDLL